MNLHTVALQLYNALLNQSCGCTRRWDHDAALGFEVTRVCGRCRALSAYETLEVSGTVDESELRCAVRSMADDIERLQSECDELRKTAMAPRKV